MSRNSSSNIDERRLLLYNQKHMTFNFSLIPIYGWIHAVVESTGEKITTPDREHEIAFICRMPIYGWIIAAVQNKERDNPY